MKKVGILGSGQLGRMMALAGYPLAIEFAIYDTSGTPTANIGKIYSDPNNKQQSLETFLNDVDLVTYEFEHLPLDLAHNIESKTSLLPNSKALAVCQNRTLEKQLFRDLSIPTAQYEVVESEEALRSAVETLGTPVVAKSTTEGYDGKGQAVIRSIDDCAAAWQSINHPQLIVESFINFNRELSILAARNPSGDTVFYPLVENNHQDGILRYTIAPAPQVAHGIQSQAKEYITRLMENLNYVGVLTLELFETNEGLLANEMAPRVHNSGHWTMDGAHTGQFENHLRAILDLPLGETTPHGVSAMINLVGDYADVPGVLSLRDTHLHHYGKQPRAGRKVGHININAETYDELLPKLKKCLAFVPGHKPLSCSLLDSMPDTNNVES